MIFVQSCRRTAAVGAALALAVAGAIAFTPRVEAAPAAAPVESVVSADSLPTVQINGVVFKQQIVGDKAFAGGEFTKARPAGSAVGVNEVSRTNLLKYDLATGVLDTSFAPEVNAQVKAMALSPDGKTLYIGGSFSKIDGQNRYRAAAFDVATGALLPWNPAFNATVNSLVATDSAVFAGGAFNKVGSVQRLSLAAVSPSGAGALLGWAPSTNATVQAIALTKDQSRAVVAGNFSRINNASAGGLGAVRISDGASLPFAANTIIQNTGNSQAFLSLQMDANDNVYGTGYAYGGTGPFLEGIFSANAMTGSLTWLADCHGDSYDALPMGNVVYTVSHHHDCTNIGGFAGQDPPTFHQRADAFTVDATGTVAKNTAYGYTNFAGQSSPSFVGWYPKVDAGTYTGMAQGPWTLAGNDEYLLMGGEFGTVNGTKQQGLARFAVRSTAPNKLGPEGDGSTLVPSFLQTSATSARATIPTTWDRDDERLTYEVYVEGQATPVGKTTADSTFWNLPTTHAELTGLAAGTQRLRVKISDPSGNYMLTPYVSFTMRGDMGEYPATVVKDTPSHYWTLGGAFPSPDLAGTMDMTANRGVGSTDAGAYTGSTASTFDGSTGMASGTTTETSPQVFSVEAWFKTTSNRGGKIVGFGDSATGISGAYDRHLYLTSAGRVAFGVYTGTQKAIASSQAYNDGQWHHVVATQSPTETVLYVDGEKATSAQGLKPTNYTGRWKIGGDNLWGWADRPASDFFAGTIDDVAVYPATLTEKQIQTHYSASGRSLELPAEPAVPTDPYGLAVYNDKPEIQWRLDETTGAYAADSSGNTRLGKVSGGVTWGTDPAVARGTAASFDGIAGLVSTRTAVASPNTYSTEVWFNTTTTKGGKIIGFGDKSLGLSEKYDRHVYMRNNGQLVFGLWSAKQWTTASSASYNDGKWHHAVATQGADGMKLYVDGKLVGSLSNTTGEVYSGYWRVGGDTPWEGNGYFQGRIDEAAVYAKVLTADQVRAHYAAGTTVNSPPVAQVTKASCVLLECSFAGTGTDADGTIVSYKWDFGDGSTATTAEASHVYRAEGTYVVTFSVTDNSGATASAQRTVTVEGAPSPFVASDDFDRTGTNWGTADKGGPWTYTTPSRFSTDGASGVITLPNATNSGTAYLNDVSVQDLDVTATIEIPKMPTGSGVQTILMMRRVDANTNYQATYQLYSDGYVRLNISTRVDGVRTSLGDVKVSTFAYTPGEKINLRATVTGNGTTTIALKAWAEGTPEPAVASMSRTDATPQLQAKGSFGIQAYLASSATEQTQVKVDSLRITRV